VNGSATASRASRVPRVPRPRSHVFACLVRDRSETYADGVVAVVTGTRTARQAIKDIEG
jgi:hypothetical protein